MSPGDRKLFFFVLLGFALLLSAWTALFTVASRHRMADVPLAHRATAQNANSATGTTEPTH